MEFQKENLKLTIQNFQRKQNKTKFVNNSSCTKEEH